jgi:hypothetical protein
MFADHRNDMRRASTNAAGQEIAMKRWIGSSLFALMLAAPAAYAEFHLFQIEQLFSNADGSVQFVVMHEFTGSNGENFWANNSFVSMHAGTPNKTFTFPSNLPSAGTANKRVLIATQGFAALGIVTPDYIVPNGFLPTNGGTVNYAGVDSVTFAALPTDGVTAITRNSTMIPNVATNFAGQSASVTAVAPPANIIPIPGVYYNAAEPGSGFGLDYQNGTLIVEVYSYLQAGAAQWYLSAGPVVNNVYTGTLDKYTGGQCISCAFVAPTLVGNDGMITITFTSPTTATVDLPGGRHFQIQRFFQ